MANARDCISQTEKHRWFESTPADHKTTPRTAGESGERMRPSCQYAVIAQSVEHFLGKEEVGGSSPLGSSRKAV